MATIGTFTQTKDGFTGTIRTLALNVKAKIVPDEHKANEAAPDYRVFSGTVELGAGWSAPPRTASNVNTSLSSSMTRAFLPRSTPIWCRPRALRTSTASSGAANLSPSAQGAPLRRCAFPMTNLVTCARLAPEHPPGSRLPTSRSASIWPRSMSDEKDRAPLRFKRDCPFLSHTMRLRVYQLLRAASTMAQMAQMAH